MYLDFGEIRFLTKVAEKSPRGLRPLLYKSKKTGTEKLVFIVKTASADVERLALSKMTWQLEKSISAPRIVILRLLILPEGDNDFYKSETGLIMNEEKDRKILETLSKQKSIEIFFFTFENDFHSKIELMTTYNMSTSAEKLNNEFAALDESRLIVQSENLSEYDLKQAMTGKINDNTLSDKDLKDSIQKKMPTISSSAPKTKPAEERTVSIKSNDILSKKPPAAKPLSEAGKKSSSDDKRTKKKTGDLTPEDLTKNSSGSEKLTADDLLKSIPPDKLKAEKIVKQSQSLQSDDDNSLKALFELFSDNSSIELSSDELLKNLSGSEKLTSDDLLKSLNTIPEDSYDIDPGAVFDQTTENKPDIDRLGKEDLLSAMRGDSIEPKNHSDKTGEVDKTTVLLRKDERDALFDELISQPSPLKDTGKLGFLSDTGKINRNPDGVITGKIPADENTPFSEPKKNNTVEVFQDDLLSALKGEETPLKDTQTDLLLALSSEETPLRKENPSDEKLLSLNTENNSNKKESDTISSISEEDLLRALTGE